MKRPRDIIEAVENPAFFGSAFKDLSTWRNWETFLRTIYGLPFQSEEELATFQECTKRETPLAGGHREIYAVCGRRGGKSRIMATIAAFEALWGNWAEGLAPGENAFIFLIAFDKTQAGQLFRYTKGLLEPFMTKEEKKRITSDTIELKEQRTVVMVKAGTFQAVRGFSTAVILLDELAFARSENSAQPVDELITALTPSIMENGLLIGASTPFTPFGYFYDQWDEHWGKDGDEVLVWHGGTLKMNPTYPAKKIEKDIRRDKAKFESEYFATFRSDIEAFLPKFMIDAAMHTAQGAPREQEMPEPGRTYHCFIDPSGGRVDSYCMAIGYKDEEGRAVLARLEERTSPADPAMVTAEFAEIAKSYGVTMVRSDRYAGEWPVSAWQKQGIRVEVTKCDKSSLYLEFVAALSMNLVKLVKHEKLLLQLQQLERRTQQGGRDVVDHPIGAQDDCANAVAGFVAHLLQNQGREPMLPVAVHAMPKELERPEVMTTRTRQSAEAELRDWMVETGCNEIVRPGMRRRNA